jgi:succinyl-CoA synthetase alpha subunit
MGILIGKNTRLIVQGITGKEGRFHTEQMQAFGTEVVGGVTPGKGGESLLGVRVYDTVAEAKKETGATASVIYVPPRAAADSIMEAADAGIGLVVCITEGIPIQDMARIKKYLAGKNTRLIGPNCPGLLSPAERCKVGIIPGRIFMPGKVGVVSRSGTLTYEAVAQLTALGIGQSTAVGIGGDPVKGTEFVEIMQMFQSDPETAAVVMIGEIGGSGEVNAAKWMRAHMSKPCAAFVAGRTAPPGKRMGHAGAIVSGAADSADGKIAALEKLGIFCAKTPDKIGEALREACRAAGILDEVRSVATV